MASKSGVESMFPPLPLEEWDESKETLHRYAQIVGKVRLAHSPFRNHWWHVPLYVTARGLTSSPIPYEHITFEISFDLLNNRLVVSTSEGEGFMFAMDDLPVAEFHRKLFDGLGALGVEVSINSKAYELGDEYTLEEFAGRFNGKTSPVHLFWHSFDLAVTRFSGRRAPEREGADKVTREAYSHEVISFGFWPGDRNTPAPAFYSYTAPEPDGLTGQPLRPEAAFWTPEGGMALLMYDDLRKADSPKTTVLEFMESAYEAGAKSAGWDIEALRTHPPAKEAAKLRKGD